MGPDSGPPLEIYRGAGPAPEVRFVRPSQQPIVAWRERGTGDIRVATLDGYAMVREIERVANHQSPLLAVAEHARDGGWAVLSARGDDLELTFTGSARKATLSYPNLQGAGLGLGGDLFVYTSEASKNVWRVIALQYDCRAIAD